MPASHCYKKNTVMGGTWAERGGAQLRVRGLCRVGGQAGPSVGGSVVQPALPHLPLYGPRRRPREQRLPLSRPLCRARSGGGGPRPVAGGEAAGAAKARRLWLRRGTPIALRGTAAVEGARAPPAQHTSSWSTGAFVSTRSNGVPPVRNFHALGTAHWRQRAHMDKKKGRCASENGHGAGAEGIKSKWQAHRAQAST